MNKIIDIDYSNDDNYDYINIYLNNNKNIKIAINNDDDYDNNYGIFLLLDDNFNYVENEYDVIKIQFCYNFDAIGAFSEDIYINNKNLYEYNYEIIEIITNNGRLYVILYDEFDNNRDIFFDYFYNDNIFSQKLTL